MCFFYRDIFQNIVRSIWTINLYNFVLSNVAIVRFWHFIFCLSDFNLLCFILCNFIVSLNFSWFVLIRHHLFTYHFFKVKLVHGSWNFHNLETIFPILFRPHLHKLIVLFFNFFIKARYVWRIGTHQ